MEITQEQQEAIDALGQKYGLKLLLLHGSYATGKQHPGSDLDIAYLRTYKLTFEQELQLFSDLASVFGDGPERELDLKSIHHTNPLFMQEVARDSQLLYGSEDHYLDFKLHAEALYEDTQGLRDLELLQSQKLLARLKQQYG